jgi:hypothetical protein
LNYTKSVLIGFCVFGLSITAWSQNLNRPSVPGIPGYLDPRTGTFKPMPQVTDSGLTSSVSPTWGRVVVNLGIAVKSTIPNTETYTCGLSVSAFDTSTGLSFVDTSQVAGTRTGNIVNCSVTLWYSWLLANPGADSMSITYTVSATNGTSAVPLHEEDHGVGTISVPLSGTTTTYNLTTYI